MPFDLPPLSDPRVLSALLSRPMLGNTAGQWLGAFLGFVLIFLILRLAVVLVVRVLARIRRGTGGEISTLAAAFLVWIPAWLWALISLLLALRMLDRTLSVERLILAGLFTIVVVLAIVLAHRILAFLLLRMIRRSRPEGMGELPVVFSVTIAVVLWSLGLLLILSNLGVNVVSLVAGLGIGGIAIALAAQNILSDFFSSYSITLDQPFKEGDFIVVGQHMGVVKKIGIKTTRLQALQGEEIVIPNQELTTTRVQNFKRMRERRIVFGFGVTYDTSPEQLREIPEAVRAIIEAEEHTRFDRAHFVRFGESGLEFEVVYYINRSEYDLYMNAQQAINLAIMERFAAQGIAFAFPTRTVHITKDEGRRTKDKGE